MLITGSSKLDLTVIVATCNRPKQLFHCLYQIRNQLLCNLSLEVIVVDESDEQDCVNEVLYFGAMVTKYIRKPRHGAFGVFSKDVGIRAASGDYLCFWDDDNIYFADAAQTLFETARGYDIGVVTTVHRDNFKCTKFVAIPRYQDNIFRHADIDTMCLCVRRSLALKHKWSACVESRLVHANDFAWVNNLMLERPSVNYTSKIIGYHL